MADQTLTLTLDTGDVVIKLRPDLAPGHVERITELAKAEFPMVPVLARAFDREHALELVQHGVDYQMRETLQSAFAMGREALIRLGDDDEVADEVMADIRNRDAERFELECVGGLSAGVALVLSNRNTSPD